MADDTQKVEKITLQNLRDVLLIAGIFLFFTGWIYVYYYDEYFGISMLSVKVDYATYLVYSFKVLTSYGYLPLVVLAGLMIFIFYRGKRNFPAMLLATLILFPALFHLSRKIGHDEALSLRHHCASSLREVQFVYRNTRELLGSDDVSDSTVAGNIILKNDLAILKSREGAPPVYLLGENQNYFIVLNQPPADPEINAVPIGQVFFVDKRDVLYAKIPVR